MRSLIVALIIHLTLNILVFLKGWNVLKRYNVARNIWTVVFLVELLIYSVGFVFYRHLPHAVVHPIRVMGTSWMLFLLYFAGLILLFDLIYLISRKQLLRPKELLNQSQRIKLATFCSSIVLVVAILAYGGYKFNHPVVNEMSLTIGKPAGKTDSVRIAVIGDMHLGYMINRHDAHRMVNLIMEQKPDLILFVGDIVDSHIEPLVQQRMDEELGRLQAPLGVFSCTGNHEYRFEAEEKIAWLNRAGITMLRDSAVLIDSAFYVVGREDFVVSTRLPLRRLLESRQVDLSRPVIVLNHTPNDLDEEADAGADIALYGHSHHGQAFPGNLATRILFEVAYGYKRKHNTHVYVTSGLGLVGPQYRVGTVSEIALLNVRFEP